MDDNYYEFLFGGLDMIDKVQILGETHIIPFKAKAKLDLVQRKDEGTSIDSKILTNIKMMFTGFHSFYQKIQK